jgi:hypothetical protein
LDDVPDFRIACACCELASCPASTMSVPEG